MESNATFSSEWTDHERLRMVACVAIVIMGAVARGEYGADGAPNMETLRVVAVGSRKELERSRQELCVLAQVVTNALAVDGRSPIGNVIGDYRGRLDAIAALATLGRDAAMAGRPPTDPLALKIFLTLALAPAREVRHVIESSKILTTDRRTGQQAFDDEAARNSQ